MCMPKAVFAALYKKKKKIFFFFLVLNKTYAAGKFYPWIIFFNI